MKNSTGWRGAGTLAESTCRVKAADARSQRGSARRHDQDVGQRRPTVSSDRAPTSASAATSKPTTRTPPPEQPVPRGRNGDQDAAEQQQPPRELADRHPQCQDDRGCAHHQRRHRQQPPTHRISPHELLGNRPLSPRPGPTWLRDAERVDLAVYAAIAQTPTPALDKAMATLTSAADYSKLSLVAAGSLAAFGGRRGRRAARDGLVSVGVTAAVVNLALKPLGGRRRPDRVAEHVPLTRHARTPWLDSRFPPVTAPPLSRSRPGSATSCRWARSRSRARRRDRILASAYRGALSRPLLAGAVSRGPGG